MKRKRKGGERQVNVSLQQDCSDPPSSCCSLGVLSDDGDAVADLEVEGGRARVVDEEAVAPVQDAHVRDAAVPGEERLEATMAAKSSSVKMVPIFLQGMVRLRSTGIGFSDESDPPLLDSMEGIFLGSSMLPPCSTRVEELYLDAVAVVFDAETVTFWPMCNRSRSELSTLGLGGPRSWSAMDWGQPRLADLLVEGVLAGFSGIVLSPFLLCCCSRSRFCFCFFFSICCCAVASACIGTGSGVRAEEDSMRHSDSV